MSEWIPDSPSIRTGKTTGIKYHLRVQGNCVEVKKRVANALTPSRVPRGVCTTFTKGARLRMLKCIAKIDWGRVPYGVFITLTYPDGYWVRDYGQRTIDRSRFLRDLEKHLGREVSVLWRIEWQRRKSGRLKGQIAPHLHLMCLGVSFVAGSVVRQLWRGVLDCHGPLATDVRGVTGKEGCGRYLAKYISKATSLDNAAYLNNPHMAGRHWGLTRPTLVPFATVEDEREITEQEYKAAVDALDQICEGNGMDARESFTLLGEIRKDLFIKIMQERGCGPYLDRL